MTPFPPAWHPCFRRWSCRLGAALLVLGMCFGLTGCALLPARPDTVSVERRRDAFPAQAAQSRLHGAVTLRWDDHLVPFIEAEDDRDVPFVLGMVHAHLRRGQMELMRLAAQGRLSEVGGPFAVDLDIAIRVIGIPRAAPGIVAALRPDTRVWLEGYVAGINAVIAAEGAACNERPWEMRIGGIDDADWTVADVASIGRLASVDPNWFAAIAQVQLRADPHWPAARARMLAAGAAVTPAFPGTWLLDPFQSTGRTGSNAFAVAGWRRLAGGSAAAGGIGSGGTSTGALLATDPHLSMALPSTWLAVGWRSPKGAMAGLTLAGLPVVLLGRNEHIAWGATNMYGAASALYDAQDLPVAEERQRLRLRWWFDRDFVLRRTSHGALVAGELITGGKPVPPLALWWRGHAPSDEFSAFLDASRARNWEEFRTAWSPYRVSAQNLIYADADGHIGQLGAFGASPGASRALIAGIGDPRDPLHDPEPLVTTSHLPQVLDLARGFVWSANNPPGHTEPPLAPFTYEDERAGRFQTLLAGEVRSAQDMIRIQLDVSAPRAQALAQAFAAHGTVAGQAPLADRLRSWDGRFAKESQGAAAYHALVRQLATRHFVKQYGEAVGAAVIRSPSMPTLLAADLASGACDAVLPAAVSGASAIIAAHPTWGDLHRLRIGHWFSDLPLIGSRLTVAEIPLDGASSTIAKAAIAGDGNPERVMYGANARVVCDLADPDGLWLAICGGQDGWIGSAAFADQVDSWSTGALRQLPLTPAAVAKAFPMAVYLKPAEPDPQTGLQGSPR